MAHYFVRVKAQGDLDDLKARLEAGDIRAIRPFGKALDYSLQHARLEADGTILWEEEDYCSPPLAMERQVVLDRYFEDIETQRIERDEGWRRIEALPRLWETQRP